MAKVPAELAGFCWNPSRPPRVTGLDMQAHHHIVGSESLGPHRLTPGYGALHRGVGLRRRAHYSLAAIGTWTFLAVAGLSLIGVLTGNP
jgi:hypothetical protein